MGLMLFLWIGLSISSSARAGSVAEPCESQEEARLVCRKPAEQVDTIIQQAKRDGKPVVFLFGSSRCGLCLAWKKYFHEHPSKFSVAYLPLAVYSKINGRPVHDQDVIASCKKTISEFSVSDRGLDPYIQHIPACERKPTIFMIDPASGRGKEIHPGRVAGGKKEISSYLDSMAKELAGKRPNLGSVPEIEKETPSQGAN